MSDTHGGRTASLRIAAGLAALVAAAVLIAASWWSAAEGRYAGWFSDSVDYLALADFYREALSGEGPPAASESYRTTRFPPLYSLLLALAGGGSDHEREAFIATAAVWLAAMLLAWMWLARRAGSPAAAAFLALAVAGCPGLFLLRLGLFSESLFIALSFLALWMCERRKPLSFSHVLALALVAGIVPLSRSIGVALAAAVALHIARLPGLARGRKLAAIAICFAPFLAWTVHRSLLPAAESYTQSLTVERLVAEFGGVGAWILGQPRRFIEAALMLWAPAGPWPLRGLAGAVLVLAAIGALQGLRRLMPDAVFALGCLGILFVWPFPAELSRMLAPLAPIIAVFAVDGAAWIAERLPPQARRPTGAGIAAVVALALLLCATPMQQRIVARLALPVDAELRAFRHLPTYFVPEGHEWALKSLEVNARVLATAREIADAVPPRSRVCTIVPGFLWLYGRRSAVDLPHGLATIEAAAPALRRCDYLFLLGATSPQHNDPPMYPVALVDPERLRPVLLARYEYRGQDGIAAGLAQLLPEAASPAIADPVTPR